jgi:hypothetical protein
MALWSPVLRSRTMADPANASVMAIDSCDWKSRSWRYKLYCICGL